MSKIAEKKDIKMTIFIMVAGIGLIVAGVIGIVTSRIESRDYKKFNRYTENFRRHC